MLKKFSRFDNIQESSRDPYVPSMGILGFFKYRVQLPTTSPLPHFGEFNKIGKHNFVFSVKYPGRIETSLYVNCLICIDD